MAEKRDGREPGPLWYLMSEYGTLTLYYTESGRGRNFLRFTSLMLLSIPKQYMTTCLSYIQHKLFLLRRGLGIAEGRFLSPLGYLSPLFQ